MQQLFSSRDKYEFLCSNREIMTLNLSYALQKLLICGLHFFSALFDCSQLMDTYELLL